MEEDNYVPAPEEGAMEDMELADQATAPVDEEADGFQRVKTSLTERYIAMETKEEAKQGDLIHKIQMDSAKRNWRNFLIQATVGAILYFLCTVNEDDPEMKANYYTQNHLAFNKLSLSLQVKGQLYSAFCLYYRPNFGMMTHRYWVDLFVATLFAAARVFLTIYWFAVIFPDFIALMKMTWTLNDKNWWKSDDEPFFASASLFNSLICNIYWCLYMFLIYFCFFFLGLLGIGIIFMVFKAKSLSDFFKTATKVLYWTVVGGASIIYNCYIIGNPILRFDLGIKGMFPPFHPHYQSHYEGGDERMKREIFLNNNRKAFASLKLADVVECPICLTKMEDEDDVVQLSCSKVHVYHTACLDDMMSRKGQNQQACGLCKGRIYY